MARGKIHVRSVAFKLGEMAEKYPDVFRVHKATRRLTDTGTLQAFKRQNIKPITRLDVIRAMAKRASAKTNTPIKITRNLPEKRCLGIAMVGKNKSPEVRLHPVLQYFPKKVARQVMLHELDHTKTLRKRILQK